GPDGRQQQRGAAPRGGARRPGGLGKERARAAAERAAGRYPRQRLEPAAAVALRGRAAVPARAGRPVLGDPIRLLADPGAAYPTAFAQVLRHLSPRDRVITLPTDDASVDRLVRALGTVLDETHRGH